MLWAILLSLSLPVDDTAELTLKSDRPVLLPNVPFTLTVTAEGKRPVFEVWITGLKGVDRVEVRNGKAVLKDVYADAQSRTLFGVTKITARTDGTVAKTLEIRVIPGWLCILPPLLAIFLAILTREVLISLFAGVWLGSLLILGFGAEELLLAALRALDTTVVTSLTDPLHVKILLFTLTMGGMVGVMTQSGGTKGIVDVLSRFAKSRRSGMLSTWIMGLLIFFDDYANCLIIGNTMRPLTDRLKISREKLSYIVDSTAAPVATLAIISTWVVVQMGYVVDSGVITPDKMFSTFVDMIPYGFYSLFTLFFVFLIAGTGRDFGPMRRAEERVVRTGQVLRPGARPLADRELSEASPPGDMSARWPNAAVPVLSLILFTSLGLYLSGRAALGEAAAGASFWKIIGNADSYNSILWGAAGAAVLAVLLAVANRHLGVLKSIEAWVAGCKGMLLAALVLVLAWSIVKTCQELSTAPWIIQTVGHKFPMQWLPAITFTLAAVVSFATGTSWGTMAILIPIVAPLAWTSPEEGIRLAGLASVLSGAIFGDHCSPISDTTVMSSMASGADHIDHVRTQLPYGILCALVAIGCGFVPTGFGLPVVPSLAAGAIVLVAVLFLLGKKPRTA